MKEKKETFSKIGVELLVDEEHSNIAIITPIMRRAHSMEFSEEIVFVDSSGSCDQANTVVTFLFGSSKIGGIPLGCVMHSNQTEVDYIKALESFKTLLGPEGFNRKKYPQIFMTDDSAAERNALRKVFPESKLLLCIFHVTQAVWRWLWSSYNKIQKNDRQHLMKLFQDVVYSSTDIECELAMKSLLKDTVTKKYNNFFKYTEQLWNRKTEWCLCSRASLTTRGHNTNNTVEASIRIFKDIVLERCKAFNICALVDFVSTTLENHHMRRLLNYANGRETKNDIAYGKFVRKASALKVVQTGENYFEVWSSQDEGNAKYKVLSDLQMCECLAGQGGKFCKHLCAVQEIYKNISTCPQLSTNDKFLFAKIALGDTAEKNSHFFFPMQQSVDTYDSNPSSSGNKNTPNEEYLHHDLSDQLEKGFNQDAPYNQEVNRFATNLNLLIELGKQKDYSLLPLLKKVNTKLEGVKTTSQLGSFLSKIVSKVGTKKRIPVQPTSISRRKRASLSKGAGRIQAGRPSNLELNRNGKIVKRSKRKHQLSVNVAANLPNAKGH